jgi:hypothetical protein
MFDNVSFLGVADTQLRCFCLLGRTVPMIERGCGFN